MRAGVVVALVWLMAAPAWAQGGGMAQRLAALDLNGDGAITRAEAERARAISFDRMDTDHDGYLSEAERNAGGEGAQQMRQGMNGADANNDGRVSRAEAMAQPYRGFDRLDSNNDGVISAEEMQALRRFGG
jgi:Ca2+-binding EF-hand superfamily protein